MQTDGIISFYPDHVEGCGADKRGRGSPRRPSWATLDWDLENATSMCDNSYADDNEELSLKTIHYSKKNKPGEMMCAKTLHLMSTIWGSSPLIKLLRPGWIAKQHKFKFSKRKFKIIFEVSLKRALGSVTSRWSSSFHLFWTWPYYWISIRHIFFSFYYNMIWSSYWKFEMITNI